MKAMDCQCNELNLQVCDHETVLDKDTVNVPDKVLGIGLDDELLIIRNNDSGADIYQGKVREITPDVALYLLQKAVQVMPWEDPEDGCSLWLDQGVIRLAS